MTAEALLPLLDGVRSRGPGKWSARCPAHADKTPSLSISQGDRALLLKCWSGCTLAEICDACGIRQRDLFFDSLDTNPQKRRAAALQREAQRKQREKYGRLLDACKAAERYLNARRPVDISAWSDDHLNRELNLIADAFHILEACPYAEHH